MDSLILKSSAPQIFGWQHLTFLAVMIVLGGVSIILIKKYCKTEKSLSIAIKIYSSILLFFIIFNRISVAVRDGKAIHFIPETFCGITSMTFSISGLFVKKNSGILHLSVYCALLGGSLGMIYPNFMVARPSFFYPVTISGLMHHVLMFFLALTMIVTGYFRPSLKKWAWLPLGLCVMLSYGQFLLSLSDIFQYKDAMFLTKPLLSGSPFTWWFCGIVLIALATIVEVVVYLIDKKRIKKQIDVVDELNKFEL